MSAAQLVLQLQFRTDVLPDEHFSSHFGTSSVLSLLPSQELGNSVGLLTAGSLVRNWYVQRIAAFRRKELNNFRSLQRKIFSFASVDTYFKN